MKKEKYFIFALLIAFLFMGTVNAGEYKVGDVITTKQDKEMSNTIGPSGWPYWKHIVTTSKGTKLTACIDPGLQDGEGRVVVGRVLFSSNSATQNAFDAGIATILAHPIDDDNVNRLVRQVAARVYVMFWPTIHTNKSEGYGQYTEIIPMYNDMISNKTIYANIKKATGTTFKKKTENKNYNKIDWYNGKTIITKRVKSDVKSYLNEAFEVAANVKKNGIAEVSIGSATTQTIKSNTTITKKITRSIKLSNFNDGASAKLYVSCYNCTANGVTTKVYVNNKLVNDYNGLDLIKKIKNGNGSVSVRLELSGANNKTCMETQYQIKVVSMDTTTKYEAYEVYPEGHKNSKDYQHLIFVNSSNNEVETEKTGNFTICPSDCEDLRSICENSGNKIACDKFNEDFGGKCADCATKIDNVECSATPSTIKINEGVEVDEKTCEYYNGNTTPNIKQCVLNKKDVAGNTYQAKTTGYPKNDYCKVYCTENYNVDVPGQQSTNSGRYIKLSAKVSGNKSCYTTPINTEKFESDLEVARKAVIDAYNNWMHYYAGINQATFEKPACSRSGCCGKCSGSDYVRTWNYSVYNYNGTTAVQSDSRSEGGCSGGCGTNCTGSVSCHSATGSGIMSELKSKLSTASSQLSNAITAYGKIVNQYNSCSSTVKQDSKLSGASSTLWKMNYNFQPKITFWYEDLYMDIAKDNKYKMYTSDNKLLTNGAGALSALNIKTCSGEVNDAYNTCTSGWVAGSGAINAKTQFTCYKTGSTFACGNLTVKTSNSKYVSEQQDANAIFELPTQFYTVYPSGKLITEAKKGTSSLEKALPISLNTKAGVYNYTLIVDDLGEFYDTGKLGRIWGKGSNKSTTIQTTLDDDSKCNSKGALTTNDVKGANTSDGAYVCSYKVNCPECTVECGPKGCEWKECKDGKCKIYCKNCIFTNGASNFNYRTVTTNDINPTDRKLGENWSTPTEATGNSNQSSVNITTATQAKAYVTKNEIIANGEKIYDKGSEEQVLTVELNQTMINDIKAYNKKYEDDGGYGSDSLKCYNYKDKNDGKTYQNVYCYSTFIDKMVKSYSKKMIFTKNRINSETARDKANNQCQGGKNCYWTAWTEANDKSKFKVYSNFGFSGNYGELGIGPSFR